MMLRSDGNIQRDLGRIEAQIDSLFHEVKALTERVGKLESRNGRNGRAWSDWRIVGPSGIGLTWLVTELLKAFG